MQSKFLYPFNRLLFPVHLMKISDDFFDQIRAFVHIQWAEGFEPGTHYGPAQNAPTFSSRFFHCCLMQWKRPTDRVERKSTGTICNRLKQTVHLRTLLCTLVVHHQHAPFGVSCRLSRSTTRIFRPKNIPPACHTSKFALKFEVSQPASLVPTTSLHTTSAASNKGANFFPSLTDPPSPRLTIRITNSFAGHYLSPFPLDNQRMLHGRMEGECGLGKCQHSASLLSFQKPGRGPHLSSIHLVSLY